MHPATAFVARTDRHFSETGFTFAFSVMAFVPGTALGAVPD